ncbi:18367_t:CDS:1, partial [Acaulospora morrowiae]
MSNINDWIMQEKNFDHNYEIEEDSDNISTIASTSQVSKESIDDNKKSLIWDFMHEEIDTNGNTIV